MRVGCFAALCHLTVAAPAAADVTIQFVAPGNYSDANLDSRYRGPPSPSVLHELEAHLARLGRLYLAPDEMLRIRILDIDLAGEIERATGTLQDRRVFSAATWPRISLHYVLEKSGKVQREAQEIVMDPGYLAMGQPGMGGTLFYEKRMLDDWFRRRFAR